VAQALEQIRSATSATLRELRTTVKLLRTPDAEPVEPSSIGLAGLLQLAARAEEADVHVTVEMDADPRSA
jgi:hypothetical protein